MQKINVIIIFQASLSIWIKMFYYLVSYIFFFVFHCYYIKTTLKNVYISICKFENCQYNNILHYNIFFKTKLDPSLRSNVCTILYVVCIFNILKQTYFIYKRKFFIKLYFKFKLFFIHIYIILMVFD